MLLDMKIGLERKNCIPGCKEENLPDLIHVGSVHKPLQ
jgi:hypothetical protein